MATLPGQRAQFTWALNQYKLSEDDSDKRVHFAKLMANTIRNAPSNGFSVEEVTQGQSYPADEIQKYFSDQNISTEPGISEAEASEKLKQLVDTSNAIYLGSGAGSVYAYGYRCAPDRLKIGRTDKDVIQRIVQQISTSTPDIPVLFLEIKSDKNQYLEKALHAILSYRGQKVLGGGDEWFITSPKEIEQLYVYLSNGGHDQTIPLKAVTS
jgi:T5orf172 domain